MAGHPLNEMQIFNVCVQRFFVLSPLANQHGFLLWTSHVKRVHFKIDRFLCATTFWVIEFKVSKTSRTVQEYVLKMVGSRFICPTRDSDLWNGSWGSYGHHQQRIHINYCCTNTFFGRYIAYIFCNWTFLR